MTTTLQDSWAEYYRKVFDSNNGWLDYSNPQVQAQTFGVTLEAAGPIAGKRCLDIGCGRGQVARALAGLHASEVVGVDIIADSINACRKRDPHIRWEVGSPDDEGFCQSLGSFDVILAIEMLQYVILKTTVHNFWNALNPGGRIVAVVPNKDNPIVQKTIARFEGTYLAPNPRDFLSIVSELPNLDCCSFRGMDFQQDQRIVPYMLSPWTSSPNPEFAPNRFVVAIQKKSATADPAKS